GQVPMDRVSKCLTLSHRGRRGTWARPSLGAAGGVFGAIGWRVESLKGTVPFSFAVRCLAVAGGPVHLFRFKRSDDSGLDVIHRADESHLPFIGPSLCFGISTDLCHGSPDVRFHSLGEANLWRTLGIEFGQ